MSIILTVLHDDCIKQRFGDNRWSIRHLLLRLSEAISVDVGNPQGSDGITTILVLEDDRSAL